MGNYAYLEAVFETWVPLWERLTKPFHTVDVGLKQDSVVLGQKEGRAIGEHVLSTNYLSWEVKERSWLWSLDFPHCSDAHGGEKVITHSPTFLHLNLCLICLAEVQYIIFIHGLS